MEKRITSPAESLLKNQKIISEHKPEIEGLIRSVGRNGDLYPSQWVQLISFIYEFRPDIILELGRGYGNSTCAFNEVCQLMKPDECAVVSLCISNDWDNHTAPNLRTLVPPGWFDTLTILNDNILTFDFEKVLKGKERVVIFWDAHGFEIAEVILGDILPRIKDRANLVIMHDLSDARYIGDAARFYGDNGIWMGKNDWSGPRIQLGNISSCVEQAISAIDFCSRNKLTLYSSDESYHTDIDDRQMDGLIQDLGPDFVSRNGHWFWFSLNEAHDELTFPQVKIKTDGAAAGRRSFLKNLLSYPCSQQPVGITTGQKSDITGIQRILKEIIFQSLFKKSGKDLIDSLETNFYNESVGKNAVLQTIDGIYVTPTTPKDHLATPFFTIKQNGEKKEKFVKVTLDFGAHPPEDIPCTIILQNNHFKNISNNLLMPGPLCIIDNKCITNIVTPDEGTDKIRLVINLDKGQTVVLPELLMIEESGQ